MSAPTTAARAAAEWWAQQVGAPTHRLVEEGQRDFSSDFAELGMLLAAHKNPVPEGAGSAFADALEKHLVDALGRHGDVHLGVDYGPDWPLSEIAQAHRIHPARFPIKTHMWVRPTHVVASLGYRGPDRLVWSAPDWERPVCHSLGYDEAGQKFGDDRCTLPRYHDGDHGDWLPDPRRCEGCGLTEGGHFNRPRVPGDFHPFCAGGESR